MPPERPWAFDPQHICNAPLMMMDDHWGAITQTCDLIVDHQGEHAALLRSCIPEAALCWPRSDLHDVEPSGSDAAEPTSDDAPTERAIERVMREVPHFDRAKAYIETFARRNLICLDCGSENHTRGHSFCNSSEASPPS